MLARMMDILERIKKDIWLAARLYPRPFMTEVQRSFMAGWDGTIPNRDTFKLSEKATAGAGLQELISDETDWELGVLTKITHRSTSEKLLEPLPADWDLRKRVFADRVQKLLNDLSPENCFDDPKLRFKKLLEEINLSNRGKSMQRILFGEVEAQENLEDLSKIGRIT